MFIGSVERLEDHWSSGSILPKNSTVFAKSARPVRQNQQNFTLSDKILQMSGKIIKITMIKCRTVLQIGFSPEKKNAVCETAVRVAVKRFYEDCKSALTLLQLFTINVK